jgi:3-hydroxyacyl-[acyl-carrier-protein] dehydratase
MRLLPHRAPFLMVDRLEVQEWGRSGVGFKAVSAIEPHFAGHFPEMPIMPGVLIVEALAQTAGLLISRTPEAEGKMGYFAGIENARFRRMVLPGELLRLEVTITRLRSSFCKASGVARVDGEVAAEAEISIALAPRPAAGAL